MSHADDNFLDAVAAGTLNQFIDQRNQAFAAFKAKAFRARVLGVQMLFKALSCAESLQQVSLYFIGETRIAEFGFNAFLNPLLLRKIDNMHELIADRPAVNILQRFNNFAQ